MRLRILEGKNRGQILYLAHCAHSRKYQCGLHDFGTIRNKDKAYIIRYGHLHTMEWFGCETLVSVKWIPQRINIESLNMRSFCSYFGEIVSIFLESINGHYKELDTKEQPNQWKYPRVFRPNKFLFHKSAKKVLTKFFWEKYELERNILFLITKVFVNQFRHSP